MATLSPERAEALHAAGRAWHAEHRNDPAYRQQRRDQIRTYRANMSPEQREAELQRLRRQAEARRCLPYTGRPNGIPTHRRPRRKPMSPPQWSVREVRGVMQRAAREYGEDIYRVIVDLLLHGNVPLLFAFLHYVDGKPVERIKVTSSPDFSELPYDELAARVETMLQRLRPRQLQSVVDVETDDGKTVEQLQHEAAEAQREAEQAQREAEAARLHCLRLQAKEQR